MPETMDEYINNEITAKTLPTKADLKKHAYRAFWKYLDEGTNKQDIIANTGIIAKQKGKLTEALDSIFDNPSTELTKKLKADIEKKIRDKVKKNKKDFEKQNLIARQAENRRQYEEEGKRPEEEPGVKAVKTSVKEIIEDYKNNKDVVLSDKFKDEFIGKFEALKEDSIDELIDKLNKEAILEEFLKSLEKGTIEEDSKSKKKKLDEIIDNIREKTSYETASEAEDSEEELEKKEVDIKKKLEENRKKYKLDEIIKKRHEDEVKLTPLEEYVKKHPEKPSISFIPEMKQINPLAKIGPEAKLQKYESIAFESISEEEKKKNILEAEIRLGVKIPDEKWWDRFTDKLSDGMKLWEGMPNTYRWLGPGTNIKKNIQAPILSHPINELDKLAQIHDLRYLKIATLESNDKYTEEKTEDTIFINDMNKLKNTLEKRINSGKYTEEKNKFYENEIHDIISTIGYMESKPEPNWLTSFAGTTHKLSEEELKEKKEEHEQFQKPELQIYFKKLDAQEKVLTELSNYMNSIVDYMEKHTEEEDTPKFEELNKIVGKLINYKNNFVEHLLELKTGLYNLNKPGHKLTKGVIIDLDDEFKELKEDTVKAIKFYKSKVNKIKYEFKEPEAKEPEGKVPKSIESNGMVVPVASTETKSGNVVIGAPVGQGPPAPLALPAPAPVPIPSASAIGTPAPSRPHVPGTFRAKHGPGVYRTKKINIAGMGQLSQNISGLTEEEQKAKDKLDENVKGFVKLDSVRYTDKVVTGERSMRASVDKRLGGDYVKLTPEEKERNIAFYSNLNFVKEGNGNGNQQLLPFSYKGWKAKNKLFDVSKLEEKLRYSGKLNVGNQYVQPRAEPTFQMRQMKEPLMFPQTQVNQRLFPVNPYAQCAVGMPITMSNERQNDFNYSSGSNYAKNSTLYFQNNVNNGFKL